MADPVASPAPAPAPEPVPDLADVLRTASQRLVRTVDALPDDDWSAWSLLPGWTRAHVVAHLALNADGLAGVLEGAVVDEAVPMYPSSAARDDDIEALAAAAPADLREHLLGSTTRFASAWSQVAQVVGETGPEVLARQAEREPGGRRFVVGDVLTMRWREVEIHHADLGTAFTCTDWSPVFSGHLVESMAARPEPVADAVLRPSDDDRRWVLGAGGAEVTGPLGDLAWWLTGRPATARLSAVGGSLPHVARW